MASVSGCAGESSGAQSNSTSTAPPAASDDSFDAENADEPILVPDIVGQDGADAESALEDADLTVSFVSSSVDEDIGSRSDGSGCEVIDQDPAADDEAASGDEVEASLDCRQVDWENRDGDEWEAYRSAFDGATEEGCEALFGETRDGSLYLDDQEFTTLDCASTSPDDAESLAPVDVPDDPETDGGSAGFEAGCDALFDSAGSTELYWGRTYYTADNCYDLNPY